MAYLQHFYNPSDDDFPLLLARNQQNTGTVAEQVQTILKTVKEQGDAALIRYASQFEGASLSSLQVSQEEMEQARSLVPSDLKGALQQAYAHIKAFHTAQLPQAEHLEIADGIQLSRNIVPYQRVGLYIPGGTAPLFSTVLMLAVPAAVAGCPQIVLCTPPDKEGKVHPAILYAASLCNVGTIYKVGGAQAIGAMAYGTKSIGRVDKIFGPGNRYVTEAKVQVSSSCCAIDMPAGPSEVMVVVSDEADPAFVASDLLSQAEHGKDSQAMLVIKGNRRSAEIQLAKVEVELARQLEMLGRQDYLLSSLSSSRAFIIDEQKACQRLVNAYGPEHLIINLGSDEADAEFAQGIVNAGSIFLGPYSCETAGDYASGTNHTLPTNGWARSYSGVSTDSFLKKITVQKVTRKGLAYLGPTLLTMAEHEQLRAHRNAVSLRLGGDR